MSKGMVFGAEIHFSPSFSFFSFFPFFPPFPFPFFLPFFPFSPLSVLALPLRFPTNGQAGIVKESGGSVTAASGVGVVAPSLYFFFSSFFFFPILLVIHLCWQEKGWKLAIIRGSRLFISPFLLLLFFLFFPPPPKV